jgi:zinc protease
VTARFGGGRQALPRDRATVAWAAGPALVASGIGTLGQDALDRLTSGRQINLGFEIADDAFALRASTRSADLADQLRLMATKLARPGWDAAPVVRTRAGFLIGLDTQDASPQGVLARDLNGLLRGGDKRWASPGRADVDALTPQSFRALWEPLLAAGPVELLIFGDFETEAMLKAVGETFGALASRPAVRAVAGSDTSNGPAPTAQPVRKFHRGAPDQAAAVLAWATGGGIDGVFESRVLDVMAQIFSDRLFEQFREGEGAAYSPDVSSNWPVALKGGGSFVVSSQVKPQSVDAFFTRARAIAADLVANPVSADELARALGPMQQQLQRASSGNSFWMNQLAGSSRDPRKIAALKSWPGDMRRISALDIQASAKRYLLPGKSFSMVVLPAKK